MPTDPGVSCKRPQTGRTMHGRTEELDFKRETTSKLLQRKGKNVSLDPRVANWMVQGGGGVPPCTHRHEALLSF